MNLHTLHTTHAVHIVTLTASTPLSLPSGVFVWRPVANLPAQDIYTCAELEAAVREAAQEIASQLFKSSLAVRIDARDRHDERRLILFSEWSLDRQIEECTAWSICSGMRSGTLYVS